MINEYLFLSLSLERLFARRILLIVLEEEVVIRIALDMNRLNAIIHQSAERVDIVFIFRRDKDAVLAQPRHPGIAEIAKREILSPYRREIIFLFGGICKIINFIEHHYTRDIFLTNIIDCLFHHFVLLFEVRMGDIHHVNQEIRLTHFVEG